MNKLGGIPEELEKGGSTGQKPSVSSQDKKQTEKIVESIYAPSGKRPQEIDEEKEKAKLRKKLHDETYFNPTFNPPKRQEEKPLEKVEREKQEEMQDLQKKEAEKPPPLAIQRAANKTERFPGTSG